MDVKIHKGILDEILKGDSKTMNTLIILGKDGLKCLDCVTLKGDYDNVKVFGKDYFKADICLAYDYVDNTYIYRIYSSKKHASCDTLAEALGGVGISKRYGMTSKPENILSSDSDKYYIIEVDIDIWHLWKNIPLRDCGNLPSHLLR